MANLGVLAQGRSWVAIRCQRGLHSSEGSPGLEHALLRALASWLQDENRAGSLGWVRFPSSAAMISWALFVPSHACVLSARI